MFRKQILAQLKAKFPGVSEKVLGLIADKMAKTVTEEDAIEGAITELDNAPISITDYADFLQREGDRRVTEAKKGNPNPANPAQPEPGDPKEPQTEIEKLTALVTGLATTVGQIVKKEQTQTIQSKMEATLKEKGIPAFMLKGRVPEKDDEIDTVLGEIEQDWTSHNQGVKNDGLGKFKAPAGSTQTDKTEKVSPAIEAFAKKQVESAKQQTV